MQQRHKISHVTTFLAHIILCIIPFTDYSKVPNIAGGEKLVCHRICFSAVINSKGERLCPLVMTLTWQCEVAQSTAPLYHTSPSLHCSSSSMPMGPVDILRKVSERTEKFPKLLFCVVVSHSFPSFRSLRHHNMHSGFQPYPTVDYTYLGARSLLHNVEGEDGM